ncbi:MAG: DUF4189 domain-containing protein [Xanthobacteraceae bacterium]|jgi:hypothetical protein
MKVIYAVIVFAALVLPSAAFAGWGAIAYNSATGASSEAHGYSSRAAAQRAALRACAGRCRIMNWEENSCIALATNSSRGWGEGHGYATQAAAIGAAISACSGNCTWKEWACN